MPKPTKLFTPDELIEGQLKILEAYEKKLNSLFIENVASKKNNTRQVLLELMGVLRETTSWYIKVSKAMIESNEKYRNTLN